MPKKQEERLKRQARKKGLTGERRNAYVYGTMENMKKKSRKRREKS